ncbi:MAG TPA: DUF6584 family protein [Stellaceae bacterium]
MAGGERRYPWRRIIAGAFATLVWTAAYAKDSPTSVKEAEQYIAQGNLKAAEIELRNAMRDAPQDPVLRARLADVYLQEGDAQSAEREARAARERNGNEADYLPVLADALLRQEKFADLTDLVQPGDRDRVLESKVRTALGTAAWGLADRAKAETLMGEAIKLDPGAARPKIQLAVERNQTGRGRQTDRRSDRRRPALGRTSSGQGPDVPQPRRPRGRHAALRPGVED